MNRALSWPPRQADTVDRLFAPLVGLFLGGGALNAVEALLVPRLKLSFGLNFAQALGIQLAYYAAYLVLAFPAAVLVARAGALRAIVAGTATIATGALALSAALFLRSFGALLGALVVTSIGVTLLQIAGNGFVAGKGQSGHAAARFTLLQGFNSLGTVIGPAAFAGFLLGGGTKSTSALPFLIFGFCFAGLSLAFRNADDEPPRREATVPRARQLVRLARTWGTEGGAAAIFAYVGAEVTIGSLAPNYLMLTERGALPAVTAGRAVSLYWLGAMIGRFAGAWALGRVGAHRLLAAAAGAAIVLVATAALPTGGVGGAALLSIGLANSIMFPTIFALAMPADARDMPAASMLLCIAVSGGAVVPALTGVVADRSGIGTALALPGLCYAAVLAFACLPARPR